MRGTGADCSMQGDGLHIGRDLREGAMSCAGICRRRVPGRGKTEYKGLEACVWQHFQESTKATVMGVECGRRISIEDEVRYRDQTRWGLAGFCTDSGFTLSNLSGQRR